MKPVYVFICLSLFCQNARAQKEKKFRINPGEKVVEVLPKNEVYTYPEYISGNVLFENNTYSPAKLNYNALFLEMQFINQKGDTMALDDEATIKQIIISNDTFYYDKGYLKLTDNFGNIKLARKDFFAFTNRQKLGGFGELSSASIDTYNSVNYGIFFKELVVQEVLTIAKRTIYYFGDEFNNFKLANKKNLLEFYPSKSKEIKTYLKENKVNFSSEEDLKKMISFLNG